jgi:hypothetical protein
LQRRADQQQTMLVRIRAIEIEPTNLGEYKAILKDEAAGSVKLGAF